MARIVALLITLAATGVEALKPQLLLSRRTAVATTSSLLAALNDRPARSYDTLPTINADFAANEKARLAREAAANKNKARVKPLLQAVARSTNEKDFSAACDELALAPAQRVHPIDSGA